MQNFLPNQNQPYRSEFLKVIGNQSPQTANGLVPNVTIFDGATGFIKWRDDWCNSHWIVLLDRTEPHFREAVDIIMRKVEDREAARQWMNGSNRNRIELLEYLSLYEDEMRGEIGLSATNLSQ